MTSDPSPEAPATYRRIFPLVSRVATRPASLSSDPWENRPGIPRCTKCQAPIVKQVTTYGDLWINSRGFGQCKQGDLHSPPL